MKTTSLAKILENTSKIKDRKEKIAYLREHYTRPFHELLAFGYDERVKWILPNGDPPYNKSSGPEYESRLAQELRIQKHFYFVEGGKSPNLDTLRRENMFIQFLEIIDSKDAELVLKLKNKKLPHKNITQELIEEAYGKLD